MKILGKSIVFAAAVLAIGTANAWTKNCTSDACKVYCSSGEYVGTMYWNGSNWSDGLRSNKDPDVVAQAMVDAQGSSCQ